MVRNRKRNSLLPRRRLWLPLLAITFSVGASLSSLVQAQTAVRRPEGSGFTILETGKSPDGKPLYSLEAYGASVHDLLTALLRRTGSDFTVASDVVGQVSLVRKNATIEELLGLLQAAARPGFIIQRGATISVIGAAGTLTEVPGIGDIRRVGPGAPAGTTLLPQVSLLARAVTLAIDEKRPVPLSQALALLARQTGAVFRLDNRIPRDLGFAAQVTNTPLQVVLDSLARSGAVKWSIQSDGTLLIAPTDWLLLSLDQRVVAGASARHCDQCGRGIAPGWSYCPACGRPVSGRSSGSTKP